MDLGVLTLRLLRVSATMEALPPDRKLAGGLCVAAAASLVGAALSGAASSFGVTDFPDDRRGEWAPRVVPLMTVMSLLLGFAGVRIVLRSGCLLSRRC